jgi:predicted hotdog family 3-hydroxylacyl-ACP dehydratase
MSMAAQTLDHTGIAARIPHSGTMCLLHSVLGWSAEDIRCRIANHADLSHPLRTTGGLLSVCAIEYAAQAMALHGALCGDAAAPPRQGALASARSVRLWVPRLDDAIGPLQLCAMLIGGDPQQALYRFELSDAAGHMLVDGRAAVVLDKVLDWRRTAAASQP